MGKYRKFIVALAGLVVSLLSVYFTDASWLPPFVAFLTALGVYQANNEDQVN